MYSNEEQRYLKKLRTAVIEMEEEEVGRIAKEILKQGYDLEHAIKEGLISAMEEVSHLYDEKRTMEKVETKKEMSEILSICFDFFVQEITRYIFLAVKRKVSYNRVLGCWGQKLLTP